MAGGVRVGITGVAPVGSVPDPAGTGILDETSPGVFANRTRDTDGTLAANSDTVIASQKATKTYADTALALKAPLASPTFTGTPAAPTPSANDNSTKVATTAYVDAAVIGLIDYKGVQNCSANPNYPASSKGDIYLVSVAGKIGGASGTTVDAGDWYIATADNAGGTEAAVGTSWGHVEHNLVTALLAANNLSDVANAATALSNLAGAPLASPTFTGDPKAPTPSVDDNDTSIATTAYVVGQAASATPAAVGTAAVGTSTRYARGDHVHAAAGRFIGRQTFVSGTAYTPTAGTNSINVACVGGGGGGGGTSSNAVNGACGGGGASGAIAIKRYTGIGAGPYTIAIGSAGTAGDNTGSTGGTGGDTTFTDGTTLITAKGGIGGTGEVFGTGIAYVDGGGGQLATNGDINSQGAPGTQGARQSGLIGMSGNGGSCSPYGGGGLGRTTGGAGRVAQGNGGGGGGGLVLNGSTAAAGGAGTVGIIVIDEYS